MSPSLFTIGIFEVGNPTPRRPPLFFWERQDLGFGAQGSFSSRLLRVDGFCELYARGALFDPYDRRANGLELADRYEYGCPDL